MVTCRERVGACVFKLQQSLFAPNTAGIACDLTLAAHDAVTRYENADGVAADRCADRSDRHGATDGCCELAIAACLPHGNAHEGMPHGFLEVGAGAQIQRNVLQCFSS